MHVRAVTRPHFTGLHPSIVGEVGRHLEVLVGDLAFRGDRIRRRHLEHDVWRTNLPALWELRQRGHARRVAFGRSGVHPLHDRVDLALREALLVAERPVLAIGVPRRHHA
jgi:hypothetical protein